MNLYFHIYIWKWQSSMKQYLAQKIEFELDEKC
jgi:hypothetical protein